MFSVVLLMAAACGVDDRADGVGECSGGDRFVLRGAFSHDTTSVSAVTVAGKVSAVAGLGGGGEVFSFGVRDITEGDLQEPGDYDVAETPLKYLKQPVSADCGETPESCEGFFAMEGVYTVLEASERYRASFELTSLRERHTTADEPGPEVSGTVSGCIDVPMI